MKEIFISQRRLLKAMSLPRDTDIVSIIPNIMKFKNGMMLNERRVKIVIMEYADDEPQKKPTWWQRLTGRW